MLFLSRNWFDLALEVLSQSNQRIIWNLFLAFIPLIFSFYLFRPAIKPSLIWWLSLLVFIAFLPNAPYILTDTIHILELIVRNYPLSIIVFVSIPQYTVFILVGFYAYVIALMRVDNYLRYLQLNNYQKTTVNAIIHILCTIGIYLGRFERFNSWDLVTRPQIVIAETFVNLTQLPVILSLAIAFLFLWSLTELIKFYNLTLWQILSSKVISD